MAELTLEEAPRKVKEMVDKGFAAMERGNLKYAIDILSDALELEPRLLKARLYLRVAQVKQFKQKKGGQITHAISMLSGMPTLMSGKSLLAKDPVKALKAGEKLLKTDPLNMTFITFFADAAIAADMPEVAIQTLEIAKEHYPKDIALLKRLGKLYLDNNATNKGRDCFETIVALKPNDPEAVKMFKDATALDTMQKGGWSGATSYRDVIKDTKEAQRLEQASKAVKTTQDVADLIQETQAKIEREPANVNYRRALADLHVRDNDFDKALEVLGEARKLTGGADPQIDRAISSVHVKRYEQEIEELTKAGDTAAAEAKKQEKSDFLFKDAEDRVARYPNDLQFRYDYGVLLYERGMLNEAIQQFQAAQRNPQRRTRSLYYLGMCFKQKKQNDIAIEQLEKAATELVTMDETKKDIYYELALIHEAAGNREKAAQYLKEIYSVDIGFRDVSQRIEQSYS